MSHCPHCRAALTPDAVRAGHCPVCQSALGTAHDTVAGLGPMGTIDLSATLDSVDAVEPAAVIDEPNRTAGVLETIVPASATAGVLETLVPANATAAIAERGMQTVDLSTVANR